MCLKLSMDSNRHFKIRVVTGPARVTWEVVISDGPIYDSKVFFTGVAKHKLPQVAPIRMLDSTIDGVLNKIQSQLRFQYPESIIEPAFQRQSLVERLVGFVVVIVVPVGLILLCAWLMQSFDEGDRSFNGSGASLELQSPGRLGVESTEAKLRRVYDSQGIKYDDKMIRDDSKAIEQLHREFGP